MVDAEEDGRIAVRFRIAKKNTKIDFWMSFSLGRQPTEGDLTKYGRNVCLFDRIYCGTKDILLDLGQIDVIGGFSVGKTKQADATINKVIPSELSNCLIYRIASTSIQCVFRRVPTYVYHNVIDVARV